MPVIITLNPASAEITTIGPKSEETAQTIAVAATPNPASNTLYQYNLPEANSLHPAEGLKTLFPGLKLQTKREVETQHPVELVRQFRPQPERGDQLSINSPGEEQNILSALAEAGLLKTFSQLTVLAHEEPLYQNAKSAQEIVELLTEHGFEHDGTNTEDPDWPSLAFKRNPLQNTVEELRSQLQNAQAKLQAEAERSKTLDQQLQEAEQELTETRNRAQQTEQKAKANQEAAEKAEAERKRTEISLNEALNEAKQTGQRLNAELDNLKARLAEAKEQQQQTQLALEQEQAAHKAAKEALESQKQERQALEEQLSQQSNTQSALKTLQDRMEYLFGQNTLQLEQAANALGQHVSHTAETTARELEAGIALQQLSPGATAISHSGLPKSAALELANQLNTKSYDLIIEMGSGSTTHFIAQALKSAGKDRFASKESEKSLSHYVEPSEDDLPRRILSFDHNRTRQKELGEKLTHAGLASYVSLQFAPLVPTQYNGREYLFYDCGTRLQQVAHLVDSRQARILIVVNIEAAETGPEPGAALPAVLQYLSAHQLDIVVHSPAQQHLTDQWLSLLNQRGLDRSAPKAFGAGQVLHITVNP